MYPEEIELALLNADTELAAAVVHIRINDKGHPIITAYLLQKNEDHQPDYRKLFQYIKTHLSLTHVPGRWVTVKDAVEVNSSGKINSKKIHDNVILLAQSYCELADARQAYVQDTGKPPPSRPAELRDWLRSVMTPRQLSRWPTTKKTGELSTSSKALKHLVETVPSAAPVLVILAKKKLIEFRHFVN